MKASCNFCGYTQHGIFFMIRCPNCKAKQPHYKPTLTDTWSAIETEFLSKAHSTDIHIGKHRWGWYVETITGSLGPYSKPRALHLGRNFRYTSFSVWDWTKL